MSLPANIFREYDIRGVVDRDLTPEVVRDIGQAVGSLAAERGETEVIVGRDGRPGPKDPAQVVAVGHRSSRVGSAATVTSTAARVVDLPPSAARRAVRPARTRWRAAGSLHPSRPAISA